MTTSQTTAEPEERTELPSDWPTVYLDELVAAIHFRTDVAEANSAGPDQVKIVPIGFRPDDEEVLLYRIYALLALTSGEATTLEHVHDAWAVWTLSYRPEHHSLVPFADLAPRVQALDEPYRAAIAEVARCHAASRKPKITRRVGTDPRRPYAIVADLITRFAARRGLAANVMTLADRFADDLADDRYTPAPLRQVVQQVQRHGSPLEFDFPEGPVAIRVDEMAPSWATVGFSFAVERWQFALSAGSDERASDPPTGHDRDGSD